MRRTIYVGDKVRVIPESYTALIKWDFHFQQMWEDLSLEGEPQVALGGEYEVLSISDDGFLRFLSGKLGDSVHASDVLTLDEFSPCPYKVGDKVRFNPRCSYDDLFHVRSAILRAGGDEDGDLTVSAVINEYYICLEVPPDDVNSFPFRWIDFERAS